MKAFAYKLDANGDLQMTIAGVIGDGWAAPDSCTTADAMRAALKSAPKAQNIKVDIESMGGDYFQGLAMYQMLQEHPATVNVSIGACAASSASLIAMAGDTISMHETSTMLVHNPWSICLGDANEMRKCAADLDLLTGTAVSAYAARTGMEPDAVASLMNEDRLMTADECKKAGFCTDVRPAKTKTSALSDTEVKAAVAKIRADAHSRLAATRAAASDPQPAPAAPPPIEPPPAPPRVPEQPKAPVAESPQLPLPTPKAMPVRAQKDTAMNLAAILALLALDAGATENEAVSAIQETEMDRGVYRETRRRGSWGREGLERVARPTCRGECEDCESREGARRQGTSRAHQQWRARGQNHSCHEELGRRAALSHTPVVLSGPAEGGWHRAKSSNR